MPTTPSQTPAAAAPAAPAAIHIVRFNSATLQFNDPSISGNGYIEAHLRDPDNEDVGECDIPGNIATGGTAQDPVDVAQIMMVGPLPNARTVFTANANGNTINNPNAVFAARVARDPANRLIIELRAPSPGGGAAQFTFTDLN